MEFLNPNGATVIAMDGTPEQIADKLLQSFIAPAFSAMKKESNELSDFFAFTVAGKSIAAHLATVEVCSIDEAADALKETINDLVIEIKKHKALKQTATTVKS